MYVCIYDVCVCVTFQYFIKHSVRNKYLRAIIYCFYYILFFDRSNQIYNDKKLQRSILYSVYTTSGFIYCQECISKNFTSSEWVTTYKISNAIGEMNGHLRGTMTGTFCLSIRTWQLIADYVKIITGNKRPSYAYKD